MIDRVRRVSQDFLHGNEETVVSGKEFACAVSNEGSMSAFSSAPNSEPDLALTARLLSETDRAAVTTFLRSDPLHLMTMRLNIEYYGFHSSTLRVWGVVDAAGAVHGIGLRFNNTLIIADSDGRSGAAFAQWIDLERGLVGVRGTEPALSLMGQNLRRLAVGDREKSVSMILRCPPVCPPEVLYKARVASFADMDKLVELYSHAGHMYRSRANIETKLRMGRLFVVEEPATFQRAARFAACALLNVEGSDGGIIGGVFTLPEARGKGYASACTAALCKDLQRDGKMPCLFYENPIAGRVYRKLGFEQVEQWGVAYLVHRRPKPTPPKV